MIILHAGALENRLLLWGEVAVEDEVSFPSRQEDKTGMAQPRPYPFDAGCTGLSSALKGTDIRFKIRKRRIQSAIAWIPTKGNNPIVSSLLVAESPKSRAKTRLAPWVVNTLPLTSEEAFELLCASVGQQTLAPGVIIGPDLAFWTKALRFAGTLVVRQRYLPGLTVNSNDYKAFWGPIFTGDDVAQLATLAMAMPPVCRALSELEKTSPPTIPAASLLKRFTANMLDHLIRLTISEDSLFRPKDGKIEQPAFESVHDSWLYALQASDSTVVGDQVELAEFADQVRTWHRPIETSEASPLRLCFRLEEPNTAKERSKKQAGSSANRWYVRYLLQAHDDPSLLIPFEDAWSAKECKVSALKRYGVNVAEHMLSSLGQAAGLCPHIYAGWVLARYNNRARVSNREGDHLRTEWLRRDAPRLVDPQGNKDTPIGSRQGQESKDAGWRRSIAGERGPVRLGTGPR